MLGALLGLEREEVDQGRLRALDLRGEHGLLADERVDEPVERRDHLAGQLEADERLLGRPEALGQGGVDTNTGSVGGKGNGTKAATSSPAAVVRSYRPVALALIESAT